MRYNILILFIRSGLSCLPPHRQTQSSNRLFPSPRLACRVWSLQDLNPASFMHETMTRKREREKNMFVMTLFLHTIPRFPFPHAPGFVNWRDYALNTVTDPGSTNVFERHGSTGFPSSLSLNQSVPASSITFTCSRYRHHHGWLPCCRRSAYAKGGVQLASLHRGSSYCYRISAVSFISLT
jgi:hypothetical protein